MLLKKTKQLTKRTSISVVVSKTNRRFLTRSLNSLSKRTCETRTKLSLENLITIQLRYLFRKMRGRILHLECTSFGNLSKITQKRFSSLNWESSMKFSITMQSYARDCSTSTGWVAPRNCILDFQKKCLISIQKRW